MPGANRVVAQEALRLQEANKIFLEISRASSLSSDPCLKNEKSRSPTEYMHCR